MEFNQAYYERYNLIENRDGKVTDTSMYSERYKHIIY
jgi:hypothetical protein